MAAFGRRSRPERAPSTVANGHNPDSSLGTGPSAADQASFDLEQYKSLRAEALDAIRDQLRTFQIGITALGVLAGFAAKLSTNHDPWPFAAEASFAAVFAAAINVIWQEQQFRAYRVGVYVRGKYKTNAARIAAQGQSWEEWLGAGGSRRRVWSHHLAVLISLALAAAAPIALGLHGLTVTPNTPAALKPVTVAVVVVACLYTVTFQVAVRHQMARLDERTTEGLTQWIWSSLRRLFGPVGREPDQALVPLTTEEQLWAIKTWRYLRVAIVVLVLGLAVAVGYQFFHGSSKRFLTSISAYYYTPVHAYFVGALVSIGVCLFCLKGNTEWEDILLNLAGAFAPIVAFVPTSDEDPTDAVLFTTHDIDASVTNNVTALLAVGAAGLIVGGVLAKRNRLTPAARIGYGIAAVAWVAALLWFVIDQSVFVHCAHFVAAGLMFSFIVAVVWLNAVDYKKKMCRPSAKNRYLGIAVGMVAAVVAMLFAKGAGWDHWLFALEVALIGLFAFFWVIQSRELWHDGLR